MTNCQYELKVSFSEIMDISVKCSKTLSKKDFLMIFVGAENARQGKKIYRESLDNLTMLSKRTNVIVIGPPYACDRTVLNGLIKDINVQIQKYIYFNLRECVFLTMNSFVHLEKRSRLGNPSYSGKKLLSSYLCDHIFHGFEASDGDDQNTKSINYSVEAEICSTACNGLERGCNQFLCMSRPDDVPNEGNNTSFLA